MNCRNTSTPNPRRTWRWLKSGLVGAAMVLFSTAEAQLAYTRTNFDGTYTPISTGGGALTAGLTGDGVFTGSLPIGFTFVYNGTPYTTFGTSTDGWMSFTATANSATNTSLFTTTAPNATLAAWWDDMNTNAVGTNPAGSILYQTTGTAPDRMLTVQWTVSSYWSATSGQPRLLNYQVKLYETTNVIEFWYGAATGTVTNTLESASIGIESATGGNGQYLDAITGSSFTCNNSMQTNRWPSYNFRFTPGAPAALAGGTYNVGVGQTYRNLNEAAADINRRGIAGAVTLNLTDAQYDVTPANGGNFFPILLGPIAGSSATNTVTITKAGAPAIIQYDGALGTNGSYGNQASATVVASNNDPIIGLVGADYVTLNNLDLRGNNTGALVDQGVMLINSSATDGATNNIIQNVSVRMNRGNTGSRGFQSNTPTTPTAASGANSNNIFRDFDIRSVYAGIQLTGNATWPDVGNQITRTNCATFNTIGDPAVANDIGNSTTATYGIQLQNQSNFICRYNEIRNVTNTGGQADGINVLTFQGFCDLNNNKILGIRNSGAASTTTIDGIRATHTTTGNHNLRIYNNAISDITSGYTGAASATRVLRGIFIAGTGGASTQFYDIYNNSVSLNGSGSPNISSACLEFATTAGPLFFVRNNSLANFTAAQPTPATTRHFGVFHTSTNLVGNTGSAITNNNVYIANDAGISGFTALGSATTYNGILAWETATAPQTGANIEVNPVYTDNNADLHSGAAGMNGSGFAPPPYVSVDLDCATRTPDNDIGAYIINACAGATAGTISGASSACSAQGTTLNLTGSSTGLGISYQWKWSSTPGGPYTNDLGTALSQSTLSLPAGTYYIVVDVTCSNGPVTATTPEFTFVNIQTPTASAANSGPVCAGATLNLDGTTDVGNVFTWTGPNGFSSTSEDASITNAPLAAGGTYTFIASLNGCASTPATTNAVVAPLPTVSATTAAPNPTCIGGNSQLNVTALVDAPFVRISEMIINRGGTGTGVIPPTIPGADLVELNNTSNLSADISGWTFSAYANNTATASHSITFPSGTLIPANSWLVITLGTGTNDPVNRVYYTGGTNDSYFSSSAIGLVLRNGGQIIDAMGAANSPTVYTFAAGTGVTVSDWSGTFFSVSGRSGFIRSAAVDSNTGADWVATNTTPVNTMGVFNAGYTNSNQSAPASYLWTPNTFLDFDNIANPLASGVTSSTAYTVTVASNAGCTAQGTVTVNTTLPITAASITGVLNYCAGGSTSLTAVPADGGVPYTYLWSPGGQTDASIVVNAPGLYNCQVTDNCGGSVNTGDVTVVENALPTVAINPNAADYCTGNTAVALTASGASTYTWSPAGGLDATTGANVNASPAATTTYTVTGTDGNGCVNTATTTITNLGVAPTITSVTATPPSVCAGDDSQLQANTGAGGSYCAATATTAGCTGDEFIDNVIFGTISNPSGCTYGAPNNSYNNFTAQSTTVSAGSVVNITVSIGNFFSSDQLAAFFDWNQDADFADAGESFVLAAPIAGPNTWAVTVPAGARNGATRMRVRLNYAATPPACGSTSFGETEDYTVIVTGGQDVTYSWSPATYLNSTTIANPLASGITTAETYTVTVTDGPCSSTGTVSVTLDNTDTDNDGTIDCIDGCPTDPNKIAPGICGCGVSDADTDGDLTVDCQDGCPADPNKIAPGQCGCGVPDTDTDGDLTADCVDGCPADPNKIAPGICGCGVSDVDSDNDGTADCNDGCPADPNKIAPGLCGCGFGEPGASCNDGNPNTIFDTVLGDCSCVGTPADCEGTPNGPALPGTPCNDNDVCTINDTWSNLCVCEGTFEDTDLDGTCDANDGCPLDPNKIAPGICGCGVADTDSDADGVADCNDPCPTLPVLTNGDPCDDGDACTINDVVSNCVCAGTPDPVTAGITASSTVYCTPGAGVTLTASGGVTYSWAPATGLSATTGSPVTATPASATTYTLTATNAVGCSDTETVTITTGTTPATPIMSAQPGLVCPGGNSQLGATIGGGTGTYCIPPLSYGCSFPDQISNVNVAGIVRSSGCDNLSGLNGYSLFASPTGSLVAGSTGNSYSITTSGDTEGAALWIDFNQNGTFENPAELIFNSYAGTNPATYTGTFTVPAGAINGNTRLRVRCTYAQAPGTDACGPDVTYGETEDYTVNITGGAPNCAAGINFSWSPTTYLDNPLVCNPLASGVMTATTYTVTATNAAGCSSTGTIAVNVETLDTDGDLTVDCLDGCPTDANKTAPGQCGCGVPDTDTDGDLTADCNDGCPNDPLKIAPGICGCGVADTDTDGDATADCFDLCPTDPNKIVPGVCGCGVADTDTDNDGVADCIDNCPLVSGVQGTACNDNNPATLNDALDANCVCTGSTLSCPDQSVVLDLTTDNSGAQTSWDIVNVGTSNVQCSGSGYLNNQSVSIGCCLATGCYELRVFDSAGDGMANGTIGGYVLRLPDGTRIIDNAGDGIFTFTSQIAGNLGFCVPLGTNSVIAAHCDKANWLPNEVIQAQVNAAVTAQFGVTNSTSGYQFWFFSPDGGYTRRVLQTHAAPGVVTGAPANVRAAYLDLSSITTSPLPLYTNLNVRIRVQIAGVYSEWGPACRFRIDPPCSTTQLTTSANPVVSCGAVGLTLSSTIYANNVAGANKYQFEFTRPGYLRRIASSSRSQILNWVTNPLQNNTCYNVRVRVSFDGGTTYCAFGPTCTVTVGTAICGFAMPTQPETFTNATETGRLTVFPNPNNGDQVTLVLSSFDRSVNTIQLDVNDIYGKFITRRNIAVQDGYMNTVLSFEQELAPGMYLLNLQAGEQRFTQRMIVQ